jgi:uncharacterized protein (TIGR03083 family)
MTTSTDHYKDAAAPLSELLDGAEAADWERSSPCDGWTVRDVVGHIISTQRDMFAERGFALPETAAYSAASWRDHCDAVLALLADEDVTTHAYDGYFGPTTVGETLERFYIFDMLVHRWDIAQAIGQSVVFSDAELDLLDDSLTAFGPNMYMPGLFVEGVTPHDPTDHQSVLLARMGRSS